LVSESRNSFQSQRERNPKIVEVHIPGRLSVIGVTKSIGLAVGVATVTRSVDLEETAEAATAVGLGVVKTVAGKVPDSTMLKRAAGEKTRRIARVFILSVMCGILTDCRWNL
jgi:hypothetical protein